MSCIFNLWNIWWKRITGTLDKLHWSIKIIFWINFVINCSWKCSTRDLFHSYILFVFITNLNWYRKQFLITLSREFLNIRVALWRILLINNYNVLHKIISFVVFIIIFMFLRTVVIWNNRHCKLRKLNCLSLRCGLILQRYFENAWHFFLFL